MKHTKNELIRRILELDAFVNKEDLVKENYEDLLDRWEELADNSNMFPNERDVDAEDEDYV